MSSDLRQLPISGGRSTVSREKAFRKVFKRHEYFRIHTGKRREENNLCLSKYDLFGKAQTEKSRKFVAVELTSTRRGRRGQDFRRPGDRPHDHATGTRREGPCVAGTHRVERGHRRDITGLPLPGLEQWTTKTRSAFVRLRPRPLVETSSLPLCSSV